MAAMKRWEASARTKNCCCFSQNGRYAEKSAFARTDSIHVSPHAADSDAGAFVVTRVSRS